MNKIKILCIVAYLDYCDGVASFLMNYYKKINHKKLKFDFIVLNDKSVCEEYKRIINSNNDNIYFLNKVNLINYMQEKKKFMNIISKNHYDILYSHLLYVSWIYFCWAKNKINRKVLHCHSIPIKNKNIIKELIYEITTKLSIFKADSLIACSNDTGKNMYKNKKYYVLRNAIEVDKYKYDEDLRKKIRKELNIENNVVIGHVGRFSEEKNHKYLIELIQTLVKIDKKYKLMLIGDGPLKKNIENIVKEKKITDNVIFLGKINNVGDYLQSMDVFVLPSFFEGLPISVIEAQFSGLLTIVSQNVSKEVKISLNTSFMNINDNNFENICKKILDNENYIREKKEYNQSEYNINFEAPKMEKVFFNIIKDKE